MSGRPSLRWWLTLALILAAGVVPRVPILYNATYAFNSDEAVNALVVKHLLEDGKLRVHNWDARYYGIVEGLMAIPFVWLASYTPLAFKLAAVLGFLLLVVATALLGRALHGPGAGLVAAALLVAFSPHAVLWSTVASGGYLLTVAWGSATFLGLEWLRRQEQIRPWQVGALGLVLGLGMYVYELFLCYLVSLGAWAALALWGRLRSGARALPWPRRTVLAGAALLVVGFAAGWSPKLRVLVQGGNLGAKAPSYSIAAPQVVWENVALLASGSMPALLGADVDAIHKWTPPRSPVTTALGWILIASHAAAWVWIGGRATRRLLRGDGEAAIDALLAVHLVATAVLFVLSPNPKEILASRYLLPCLTTLPVLSAAMLRRIAQRRRSLGAMLTVFLVAFPLVQVVRAARNEGFLGPGLRLVRIPEPLEQVLAHLKERGIDTAWGTYWAAYKATFLSDEQIIVAPLFDWDRYPEYKRRVRNSPSEAYILEPEFPGQRELRLRLAERGAAVLSVPIDRYTVVSARDGGRVLSRFELFPARQIIHPRARIRVLAMPPRMLAREPYEVTVRMTNTGDESWSRDGLVGGTHRVAAGYRWLYPDGRALVEEGERTLLPEDVGTGETVQMAVRVTAPPQTGSFLLQLTLVQEGFAWFDQQGGVATILPVEVLSASAPTR